MTSADVRPGLDRMDLFEAAARVRGHVRCAVRGQDHPVSPVSEGFVAVCPRGFERDLPAVFGALGWARPVALLRDHHRLGRFAAAATESEHLTPAASDADRDGAGEGGNPPPTFVIPRRFLRRRAAAIGHRLSLCRPFRGGPTQHVRAIGVGPWISSGAIDYAEALGACTDAVMSDWTYLNTFPRMPGAELLTAHVVPYQFDDFDANIGIVDVTLRRLQEKGVTNVGLFIEGNPDTYDVLDGLSLAGRRVDVTPGIPIGLLAVADVAGQFRHDPLGSSFAYFSGMHSRHQAPPEQFLAELTCYLTAGISCVLVEMWKGDIRLALRAIELTARPMTAVLLSNYFSDSASTTFVVGRHGMDARRALDAARGGLSTMLITPETLS